jgi:hypothetical protein
MAENQGDCFGRLDFPPSKDALMLAVPAMKVGMRS